MASIFRKGAFVKDSSEFFAKTFDDKQPICKIRYIDISPIQLYFKVTGTTLLKFFRLLIRFFMNF